MHTVSNGGIEVWRSSAVSYARTSLHMLSHHPASSSPVSLLLSGLAPLYHTAYPPTAPPISRKLPVANHRKSRCECHTAAAIQCVKLITLTMAISVPPKDERWDTGTRVCVNWVAERSYVQRKRSESEMKAMTRMVETREVECWGGVVVGEERVESR